MLLEILLAATLGIDDEAGMDNEAGKDDEVLGRSTSAGLFSITPRLLFS